MRRESSGEHAVAHPAVPPLRFIGLEALSGIVLLAAAAAAFAWANSPWAASYTALWQLEPIPGLARALPAADLRFWVDDGLMTLFFLVVGLEIRREMHDGALSERKVAALPVIAAAGGVALPALIYVFVNAILAGNGVALRGWAIPTASDIAFAVGVLSLVGARVPPALRMLLLTLAIIDDIVAIVVIAFFYSSGLALGGLGIAALGVAMALLLQSLGVRSALACVLPGAVVWLGLLRAGVHPTLAGVVLGLIAPVRAAHGRRGNPAAAPREGVSPLVRVEGALHPYVAFGIMPLFALANAGVSLAGLDLAGSAARAVVVGIVLALVLGKPAGILLAATAAVRAGLCALPAGVRWRHMALLGCLAGIGFSMAIFMANLAFPAAVLLTAAKFSVLAASVVAATVGLAVGFAISRLRGAQRATERRWS